jgi:hypothetical protein
VCNIKYVFSKTNVSAHPGNRTPVDQNVFGGCTFELLSSQTLTYCKPLCFLEHGTSEDKLLVSRPGHFTLGEELPLCPLDRWFHSSETVSALDLR